MQLTIGRRGVAVTGAGRGTSRTSATTPPKTRTRNSRCPRRCRSPATSTSEPVSAIFTHFLPTCECHFHPLVSVIFTHFYPLVSAIFTHFLPTCECHFTHFYPLVSAFFTHFLPTCECHFYPFFTHL